jgi:GNAT superfamily N-acetyltransferase
MDKLRIDTTDLESVLTLRTQFLDPPRSREEALSPGDTARECVHFGAYLDGTLVGVCSVGPEPLPVLDHPPAWRMRGLVVLPQLRGSGIGTELIKHRLRHVAAQSNPLAWGFAKRRLIALYSSLGYCPTGYTYVHPVGGETLLFGNQPTLHWIEQATGVSYSGEELPALGPVDPHE